MTINPVRPTPTERFCITFIGGGHLAQAMIQGILSSEKAKEVDRIAITARRSDRARELKAKFPDALVTLDNLDPDLWAPITSHTVFVCTRPADVPGIFTQLSNLLVTLDPTIRPTLVTMCPGVRIAQLEERLPANSAIIRSMPNTPLEVGEGATALCANPGASGRVNHVAAIFQTICPVVRVVEEHLLDVVAAVAGSAPAYFYYLIESLVAAAGAHGLSPDIAEAMITQSCIGAGVLARAANRSVESLRQEVCVPGGSTEKAILNLRKGDLPGIVQSSVEKSIQANRAMGEIGEAEE
ncbi:hypothetical protein N7510_005787 [Penicillium lagena]|uniref:uncharacterized protein n=1 Tax=Penicillium lagena TaxID=94218 RepID=UPI002540E6CA|nr:uncharacterized protein N7510_005787 [Penicillium lagena]KAJ5612593.1 hypothetical protein N7510_005787 [Penicillium lagena]